MLCNSLKQITLPLAATEKLKLRDQRLWATIVWQLHIGKQVFYLILFASDISEGVDSSVGFGFQHECSELLFCLFGCFDFRFLVNMPWATVAAAHSPSRLPLDPGMRNFLSVL